MSQELLYTSASRGLKPGSRGFCTVAATPGMPANLAERLESLSGYRHVFAPQDPLASLNPIVWSHLRMSVAGRPYHVLSRVAAAGLDYTQRSNKIAHHVALDPAEAPLAETLPAGPAALLSAAGYMLTDWDGETRMLPTDRSSPPPTSLSGVCRRWQQVSGDAGWGGVLAQTALCEAPKPVTIIYPPGVDILPLLCEAMAVTPPAARWQITFSTYFTKLPPGIDCLWRGVIETSPEAQAARRAPGALIIDLCQSLPLAGSGPLIEAARTGVTPAEDFLRPMVASAQPASAELDHDGIDLSTLTYDPAGSSRRRPTPAPQRSRLRYWIGLAAAVVVILGVGLAGAVFYYRGQRVAQAPPDANQSAAPVASTTEPSTAEATAAAQKLQKAVEALAEAVNSRHWSTARTCIDEIEQNHHDELSNNPGAKQEIANARATLANVFQERKIRLKNLIAGPSLQAARDGLAQERKDRLFSDPAELQELQQQFDDLVKTIREQRLAAATQTLEAGRYADAGKQLAAMQRDAALLKIDPAKLTALKTQIDAALLTEEQWRQLPAAIDLGDRTAAGEEQGRIQIPDSAALAAAGLKVSLAGGSKVCKARSDFRLLASSDDASLPMWTVRYEAPSLGDPTRIKVAALGADAEGLHIDWLKPAVTLREADLLRNCALQLAINRHPAKLIYLRAPQRDPKKCFPMAKLGLSGSLPPKRVIQLDDLPPAIDPTLVLIAPRPTIPGDFEATTSPDGQSIWIGFTDDKAPAPQPPKAAGPIAGDPIATDPNAAKSNTTDPADEQIGVLLKAQVNTTRDPNGSATLTITLDAGIRSDAWRDRLTKASDPVQANAQFPPMALPTADGETHWTADGLKAIVDLYGKDAKAQSSQNPPDANTIEQRRIALLRAKQAQWLIENVFGPDAESIIHFRIVLNVRDEKIPYRLPLFTTEER